MWRFTLVLAFLAVAAACSGGGGGKTALTEDGRIRATVELTYELITDGRWGDLWNNYSNDFRERCSYNAMIDALDVLRGEGVASLEVSAFTEIEFIGDRARASYSVVGFDESGQQSASYNYETLLVKEDGQWRLEEACF